MPCVFYQFKDGSVLAFEQYPRQPKYRQLLRQEWEVIFKDVLEQESATERVAPERPRQEPEQRENAPADRVVDQQEAPAEGPRQRVDDLDQFPQRYQLTCTCGTNFVSREPERPCPDCGSILRAGAGLVEGCGRRWYTLEPKRQRSCPRGQPACEICSGPIQSGQLYVKPENYKGRKRAHLHCVKGEEA